MNRPLIVTILAGCLGVGIVYSLPKHNWQGAHAIDGDTFSLRAEHQHYRLRNMDAPEMPGHCRGYRAAHNTCAAGDPYESQRALQTLLDDPAFTCTPIGQDVYARGLVDCTVGVKQEDVATILINQGFAQPYEYKGH
jgi:endonuclease YncB( thermonuclease family)